MMHNVKTDFAMEFHGFFVSDSLPQQVVEANPFLALLGIPGIENGRKFNPVNMQVVVRMLQKKILDRLPFMGMSQQPYRIGLRHMPTPIPCEARFRTHAWTACVTNE